MTNREKQALKLLADRIDELASLENCDCNEKSKDDFKSYMEWFRVCSMQLRKVVQLSDEKCRWFKSEELDKIIRSNL